MSSCPSVALGIVHHWSLAALRCMPMITFRRPREYGTHVSFLRQTIKSGLGVRGPDQDQGKAGHWSKELHSAYVHYVKPATILTSHPQFVEETGAQDVKELTQGHPASKCQIQDLSPGLPDCKTCSNLL